MEGFGKETPGYGRHVRWAGALVLLTASGCANRAVPALVAQKHYREAICAAVDLGEQDVVAAALAKDANLHLHAYRVRRQELAQVLDEEAAAAVDARSSFVRVGLQSNAIPVDGYTVRVGFETTGSSAAAAAPVNWKALAQATEEPLPPKVARRTYLTGQNLLKGAAAVLTAGFSFFVTGLPREGTVMVTAPRRDFLRYAPMATALHDAMGHSGCRPPGIGAHVQTRCETFFVLTGAAKTPWVMRVEQTFMSKRVTSRRSGKEAQCRIHSVHEVSIGSLEGGIEQRFGQRMQPLAHIE